MIALVTVSDAAVFWCAGTVVSALAVLVVLEVGRVRWSSRGVLDMASAVSKELNKTC